MPDSMLWIYFIVFAVLAIGIFIYAFRSLGPAKGVEKQIMALQDQAEEE